MDSISQLVLGAAVGETVLGKKLGNRAILWGAIGGTIPDLDVLSGFFLSELGELTFHRGISHSLLFSVLFALLLGWLIHRFNKPTSLVTRKEWQMMLFLAFFTHVILDCFTVYGTQVFAPFSSYRVSWGSVAVVDPLYTIPLLLSLIITAFIIRTKKTRRVVNYLGLALSTLYLLFTVYNKGRVQKIFENEFKAQNIEVTRMMTSPTIFNNILWSCTAEANDAYYVGLYSFYDTVPVKFSKIEKQHTLIQNIDSDHTITSLRWFSDNYFCIEKVDGKLFFNDLRFGAYFDKEGNNTDYIFSFLLEEHDGKYDMVETIIGPPKDQDQEYIDNFFARIWGEN
ncbi:MAG: metal-dependent hydrolase [Bacteroidetes bacterium]|nr:metal-dependent hydrolase [Bacteroidota bacterium]MDA0981309.1 metal-dependent hydrolase [Bacteroidota bacterium]